jgi:hypothetical protein
MFLSTAELAQMRSDVANMLPDTAIIYAITSTVDGAGGATFGTAAVTGGTVACRVDPNGVGKNRVIVEPARQGLMAEYIITLPYNAPISAGNQVATGGNTYQVVDLVRDHSWNVSRRALANRIG